MVLFGYKLPLRLLSAVYAWVHVLQVYLNLAVSFPSFFLNYKITEILPMRGLIGQKPVIYFTDKPIENLKILSLFYTSNKLHSLTVYQRYNQLLGVQEKSL